MAFNIFTSGRNTSFSSQLNSNYNLLLVNDLRSYLNFKKISLDSGYTLRGYNDYFYATENGTSDFGIDCTEEDGQGNATNGFHSVTHDFFYTGIHYDIYNSSVDTTKWTGSGDGTNSETVTYIQRTVTSGSATSVTLAMKGSSASANLYPSTGTTSECLFKFDINMGTGTPVTLMQITDGTNNVTVKTASVQMAGTYRMVVDSSADTITYYTSSADTSGTSVSIASLTGTEWYLKFTASSDSGTNSVVIYNFVYARGSSFDTRYFTTSAQTLTASSSKGIMTLIQGQTPTSSTGHTLQLSANNGSNYSDITESTVSTIANAGSTGIARVKAPTSGNLLFKFTDFAARILA